jgi:hypothetical protein
MADRAPNSDSLASAAALLEEGVSRFLSRDRSAYTCLSVAEAVFDRAGDHWNASIARQWRGADLGSDET